MTSRYSILAYWGPRPESPADCAPKMLQMFRTLADIDPALGRFYWADRKIGKPLLVSSLKVDDAARLLAQRQNLAEVTRQPIPEFGYRFVATNQFSRGPHYLVINGQLGGYVTANLLANYVCLATEPLAPHNEGIINFRVFRSVLLALASIWNATWCCAASDDLLQLIPRVDRARHRPRLDGGWLTYLAAPFAAKITPPSSAKCERVNGGLLMIATEETFQADNPAHVAVARDIDAALAPINALPWPPDNAIGMSRDPRA